MAERPQRLSPLGPSPRPEADPVTSGPPGASDGRSVAIEERTGFSIVQIEVRDLELSGMGEVWSWAGIADAPGVKRASTSSSHVALSIGPGRWLLVTADDPESQLEAKLSARAGPGAGVTDLSHARTVFRISGSSAVEVLAKGCPVDIEALDEGACCVSLLGPVSVVIHCLEDGDGYDVYGPRSYARSLWEWLHDAAAEFQDD